MKLDILVLNEKFEAVDLIDSYESIIWTDRYNKYGDFELYLVANEKHVSALILDRYIQIENSDHLMIITKVKIESDVENGNHITVTGKSLESILDRRIIWQQTNLNGSLQDGIKKLLDQNVISPKISNRKIENFIFEASDDERITSLRLEAQYTGDNLYEVIQKICETENIGYKIRLTDDNKFIFKLYIGEDRSYEQEENPYVIFSPSFENIIDSSYIDSKIEYKNVTLVAGEGEEYSRRTLTVGDEAATGLKRYELYTDARDITSENPETEETLTPAQYNEKLRQRGNEKLSEYSMKRTYDGEVEATQMYRYGEHFFMGDICQLENEFTSEIRARVVEYIYSDNTNGIETYPTFSILNEEE